jgi:hypothetical protein
MPQVLAEINLELQAMFIAFMSIHEDGESSTQSSVSDSDKSCV